jgi:hypothetical protein
VIRSEETKNKISQSLKSLYIGENSALFGRVHTEETKSLMSKSKVGTKNPLYGKYHTEQTKALMSKAKLAAPLTLPTGSDLREREVGRKLMTIKQKMPFLLQKELQSIYTKVLFLPT